MNKKAAFSPSKKALVTLSAVVALNLPAAHKALAQSVSCIQDLVFGSVIACGVANPLEVTPAGAISSPNCTRGGGPYSRGRCLVFGTFPPQAMSISFAANTVTLTKGADTMQVTGLDMVANGQASTTVTAFTADIPYGGTLNVGGAQAAGSYQGTITLNANYM